MLRLIILSIPFLFLVSCKTTPTGRKQLALVPEGQLTAMGSQGFEDMKKKMKIEKDPKINAYVRCVADSITAVIPGKQDWEVVVFQDDSANAFALPGGKIGVHTGLLKVAKNQSQLATVVGHEVAHVLADHSQGRVSEQLVMVGGLAVLGEVMNRRGGQNYQVIMAALGLGAQVGLILPNGRAQESEADVLGLEYMASAGFDPRESVKLWENMASASQGSPPEFLSTHPSHGTRIENLSAQIQKTLPLYERVAKKPSCGP